MAKKTSFSSPPEMMESAGSFVAVPASCCKPRISRALRKTFGMTPPQTRSTSGTARERWLCWTRGSGEKLADIALGAHPESFRLEESGPLVFMNLINSYWL